MLENDLFSSVQLMFFPTDRRENENSGMQWVKTVNAHYALDRVDIQIKL